MWVTEVKPCLMKCNDDILPNDTTKNCVFLAELNFDVTSNNGLVLLDSDVDIEESQRQFLLASQDQQNYLAPLSMWAKSLSEGVIPAFITGSETTDESPTSLLESVQVQKKIVLPGYEAHFGRGTARALFNQLASMHFLTTGTNAFSGEALFSLPLPEDMDHSQGMQFRLVWGFQGNPEPADIEFTWVVGARLYEAGTPTEAYESVDVPVSAPNTDRNAVLATPFVDFDNSVVFNEDQIYGAMHVSIVDPGVALPQIYLMQVDLRYTANPLVGSI